MFARKVSMHLKPNSVPEFTEKLEREILPILRKQKGFQDEMAFVSPSGSEAFAISVWDQAESADDYNRKSYAEVSKILATVIERPAQVETYNVVSSTLQKIAATVSA